MGASADRRSGSAAGSADPRPTHATRSPTGAAAISTASQREVPSGCHWPLIPSPGPLRDLVPRLRVSISPQPPRANEIAHHPLTGSCTIYISIESHALEGRRPTSAPGREPRLVHRSHPHGPVPQADPHGRAGRSPRRHRPARATARPRRPSGAGASSPSARTSGSSGWQPGDRRRAVRGRRPWRPRPASADVPAWPRRAESPFCPLPGRRTRSHGPRRPRRDRHDRMRRAAKTGREAP